MQNWLHELVLQPYILQMELQATREKKTPLKA